MALIEGRAYAGCTSGAAPHAKKAGSMALLPARLGYEASTVRQSPITVRLGTDSVNPFRQQICKSLVSVELNPQNRR
jgi:hypothetical protein